MPDKYVIDCSVALKWFLGDEADTDKADIIQERFLSGEIELVAPPHFKYEFGAGLRRAARRARIADADAEQAFRDFLALGIPIEHQDDAELQRVWTLAVVINYWFYDSAYVILAKRLGCRWLTADTAFPVSHSAVSANVLVLNALT